MPARRFQCYNDDMSLASSPVTDADILTAVLAPEQPDLPPELSRFFLALRFSPEQIRRMHELADKNNIGSLSEGETAEMESFARIGTLISLLQSKARRSLNSRSENSDQK